MLEGINPLLTGELLKHLDEMGHSDSVVVADAHFPSHALGARVVDLPGTSTPAVLAAIRSVVPLDDAPALDLMESADATVLDVQRELMAAAGAGSEQTRFIERFAYYEIAKTSYLIVRTGEIRKYANALLRKGVVGHPAA
ncbi:RbsD/FucU family protein [Leucobacter sp. HY1910]